MRFMLAVFCMMFLFSTHVEGQKRDNKPRDVKVRKVRNKQFSTSYDFEESVLQGQMKAPLSVVLKGRRDASKGQIIQLRKNFRNELRSSRPGVLRHSR